MNEKAAMNLRQEAERHLRSKKAASVEGMADSPARGIARAVTPSPA